MEAGDDMDATSSDCKQTPYFIGKYCHLMLPKKPLKFGLIFIFYLMLEVAGGINAHAQTFHVGIREKQDSFRSVKRHILKNDEKMSIDLKSVGWRSCEINRTDGGIYFLCHIDGDRSISGGCHIAGSRRFEVDFSGKNHYISIEATCGD